MGNIDERIESIIEDTLENFFKNRVVEVHIVDEKTNQFLVKLKIDVIPPIGTILEFKANDSEKYFRNFKFRTIIKSIEITDLEEFPVNGRQPYYRFNVEVLDRKEVECYY